MSETTVTLELTPSLTSMAVLAVAADAVYLRLPRELQRDCGGCHCEHCRVNPALAVWDTLVVPTNPAGSRDDYYATHSYTVHMPDGAVAGFQEYLRRTGNAPRLRRPAVA
jgi:hypothetical protein